MYAHPRLYNVIKRLHICLLPMSSILMYMHTLTLCGCVKDEDGCVCMNICTCFMHECECTLIILKNKVHNK